MTKNINKDKYLIIGYGRFGQGFAKRLLQEGVKEKNICIVDRNEELANLAINTFTNVIVTHLSDFDTIDEFDINEISVVVIALSDIEDSLMIAANCKKYRNKIYYAKAKNEVHSRLLKTLNVNEVVIPEYEIGSKMAYKSLFKNNNIEIDDINTNDLGIDHNIIHFVIKKSKIIGKSISELKDLRNKCEFNIFGIKRDNIFFIPNGNEVFQPNDKISIVCRKSDSKEILDYFI